MLHIAIDNDYVCACYVLAISVSNVLGFILWNTLNFYLYWEMPEDESDGILYLKHAQYQVGLKVFLCNDAAKYLFH